MNCYKIRNKVTGLFYNRTGWPVWSDKGKTYTHRASLTRHVNELTDSVLHKLRDLEIVKYEVTEVDSIPFADY